jgi:hypothetical protein
MVALFRVGSAVACAVVLAACESVTVQSPVGCSVTPRMQMRRVACPITVCAAPDGDRGARLAAAQDVGLLGFLPEDLSMMPGKQLVYRRRPPEPLPAVI